MQVSQISEKLGLVGRAVVEHLETLEDWDVIGVSRRKPNWETQTPFLSIDARDRASCEAQLSGLQDVTHLVYTALYSLSLLAFILSMMSFDLETLPGRLSG